MTVCYVYTLVWNDRHYYHGHTKDFKQRRRQHLKKLRKDKHANEHMQRLYNKYGHWHGEIVREFPNSLVAVQVEQILIDRDIKKEKCINMNPSAFLPPKLTKEQYIAIGKKNGPKAGKISYENKTGIHGLSPEKKANIVEGEDKKR